MLDALLHRARHRVIYDENFVCYLRLEKLQQRKRVLLKLTERNRGEMEAIINKFKRKPLVTLASLQNKELDKPIR